MNKLKDTLRFITPLKLAIAYVLFAIYYIIKSNVNDPSVKAWAYMFAMGYFIFALIIWAIDFLLIRHVKHKTAFWILQMTVFGLLVLLFVDRGLQGRL